jgi:bifunctional non-homologous end joining protein LigD
VGERCSFWIAASGLLRTSSPPEIALAASDLKFVLEGDRLHGGWVLVQYARPGDNDAVLAQERSVASGRRLAQISAGTGRAPEPFMLPTGTVTKADAAWNSNRGPWEGPGALDAKAPANAVAAARAKDPRPSAQSVRQAKGAGAPMPITTATFCPRSAVSDRSSEPPYACKSGCR